MALGSHQVRTEITQQDGSGTHVVQRVTQLPPPHEGSGSVNRFLGVCRRHVCTAVTQTVFLSKGSCQDISDTLAKLVKSPGFVVRYVEASPSIK